MPVLPLKSDRERSTNFEYDVEGSRGLDAFGGADSSALHSLIHYQSSGQ